VDRRDTVELLDDPSLPEEVVAEAYRDLAWTHRWLGNTRAILVRLKDGDAQSVLDLGCGQGALLRRSAASSACASTVSTCALRREARVSLS
jgi:hypothetical protein